MLKRYESILRLFAVYKFFCNDSLLSDKDESILEWFCVDLMRQGYESPELASCAVSFSAECFAQVIQQYDIKPPPAFYFYTLQVCNSLGILIEFDEAATPTTDMVFKKIEAALACWEEFRGTDDFEEAFAMDPLCQQVNIIIDKLEYLDYGYADEIFDLSQAIIHTKKRGQTKCICYYCQNYTLDELFANKHNLEKEVITSYLSTLKELHKLTGVRTALTSFNFF